MARTLTALVLLGASAVARAQAPEVLTLDGKASALTFHLVHKLHRFDVRATRLEGKARLAGGQAQVMVRAAVEGFDSGNVNRDEHLKEIMDAARFPVVEVKAVGPLAAPAQLPATVDGKYKVQIAMHGVEHLVELPVAVTFESAGRARAKAHFSVSLDAYKVERPSLMLVKMEDEVVIDADLVFAR
jgi:hypothetical protein